MTTKSMLIFMLLSLSTLCFIACTETVEQADADIPEPTTLADVLSAKEMSTFAKLLTETNLLEELNAKSDEITILAPSDAAFSALDPADLETITSDADGLKMLLKRHILAKKLALDELADLTEVETLSQEKLPLSQTDTQALKIGDIVVTEGNFSCDQGLIHRLNAIIMLDSAVAPNP
jgi:uncharacterized surface protein with fasciclin (FAS1) repeats